MFDKMLNLLWQLFFAIVPILTVVNGQILNKKSCHLVTLDSFRTTQNLVGKFERRFWRKNLKYDFGGKFEI